jgi:hypothetical protein
MTGTIDRVEVITSVQRRRRLFAVAWLVKGWGDGGAARGNGRNGFRRTTEEDPTGTASGCRN